MKLGIGGSLFCCLLDWACCSSSEEVTVPDSDGLGSMSSLDDRSIGRGGWEPASEDSFCFCRRKRRGSFPFFLRRRLSAER